ncbi:MAG TPA: M56 family metallopeptidase [Telluria sp.]|nr:M56 family metallopeptidase [Telluria sp.]
MNPTIAAIGWTLLDFVWQGALVGLAAASLLALMRGATPGQRYLVACGALLACFAWPAWTLAERLAAPDAGGSLLQAGALIAAGSVAPVNMGAIERHLGTIVVCWAACALALGLRMSLGLLWIGRAGAKRGRVDAALQLRLQQLADRFGVTRAVCVRVVEDLASPITAGWLRPVVLVPASLVTGMPPELLEALLAHEMAHIKRMDYLVNLGQNVIETLLFYHPAVWWISKQVRDEREKIADDFAASQLGEPRRLALALSELEKIQFSHYRLAQAANGGDLMSRIKRLIKPEQQVSGWKAALPVLCLVLGTCALQFTQPAYADPTADASVKPPAMNFASCTKPHYPAESLARKAEGTVTMMFNVTADGAIADGKIQRSSGDRLLDEAALTALNKCTFKPGTRNGKPEAMPAHVQYVWTLK